MAGIMNKVKKKKEQEAVSEPKKVTAGAAPAAQDKLSSGTTAQKKTAGGTATRVKNKLGSVKQNTPAKKTISFPELNAGLKTGGYSMPANASSTIAAGGVPKLVKGVQAPTTTPVGPIDISRTNKKYGSEFTDQYFQNHPDIGIIYKKSDEMTPEELAKRILLNCQSQSGTNFYLSANDTDTSDKYDNDSIYGYNTDKSPQRNEWLAYFAQSASDDDFVNALKMFDDEIEKAQDSPADRARLENVRDQFLQNGLRGRHQGVLDYEREHQQQVYDRVNGAYKVAEDRSRSPLKRELDRYNDDPQGLLAALNDPASELSKYAGMIDYGADNEGLSDETKAQWARNALNEIIANEDAAGAENAEPDAYSVEMSQAQSAYDRSNTTLDNYQKIFDTYAEVDSYTDRYRTDNEPEFLHAAREYRGAYQSGTYGGYEGGVDPVTGEDTTHQTQPTIDDAVYDPQGVLNFAVSDAATTVDERNETLRLQNIAEYAQYMSDSEKAMFSYLRSVMPEEAEHFLDLLSQSYTGERRDYARALERYNQTNGKNADGSAYNGFQEAWQIAKNIGMLGLKGVETLATPVVMASLLGKKLRGEDISQYDQVMDITKDEKNILSGVAQHADRVMPIAQLSEELGGQSIGAFITQTFSSALDNTIQMAVGMGFGSLLGLSGSALTESIKATTLFIMGNQVASQALMEGYADPSKSEAEIWCDAGAQMFAELASETFLSWDRLGDVKLFQGGSNGFKDWLGNAIMTGVSEGLEENTSDILNFAYSELMYGTNDYYDVYQQYLANTNNDPEKALNLTIGYIAGHAAESFAGGFLSTTGNAIVGGARDVVSNIINERKANTETGNYYLGQTDMAEVNTTVDKILQAGLASDNKRLQKDAQRIMDRLKANGYDFSAVNADIDQLRSVLDNRDELNPQSEEIKAPDESEEPQSTYDAQEAQAPTAQEEVQNESQGTEETETRTNAETAAETQDTGSVESETEKLSVEEIDTKTVDVKKTLAEARKAVNKLEKRLAKAVGVDREKIEQKIGEYREKIKGYIEQRDALEAQKKAALEQNRESLNAINEDNAALAEIKQQNRMDEARAENAQTDAAIKEDQQAEREINAQNKEREEAAAKLKQIGESFGSYLSKGDIRKIGSIARRVSKALSGQFTELYTAETRQKIKDMVGNEDGITDAMVDIVVDIANDNATDEQMETLDAYLKTSPNSMLTKVISDVVTASGDFERSAYSYKVQEAAQTYRNTFNVPIYGFTEEASAAVPSAAMSAEAMAATKPAKALPSTANRVSMDGKTGIVGADGSTMEGITLGTHSVEDGQLVRSVTKTSGANVDTTYNQTQRNLIGRDNNEAALFTVTREVSDLNADVADAVDAAGRIAIDAGMKGSDYRNMMLTVRHYASAGIAYADVASSIIDRTEKSIADTKEFKRAVKAVYDQGAKQTSERYNDRVSRLKGRKGGKFTAQGINRESLSRQNQAAYDLLKRLADSGAVNVEITDSPVDESGNYVYGNGSYNPNTNTITVDVNAGRMNINDGIRAFMGGTLAHELVHFGSAMTVDEYDALKRAVAKILTKNGNRTFDELVADQMEKLDPKHADGTWKTEAELYDQAVEEVVAQASVMMLDENGFQAVMNENKTLAQKILDILKRIVDAIKEAFTGMEANTAESNLIQELATVEEMEDLINKYNAMVAAAIGNSIEAQSANQMSGEAFTETQSEDIVTDEVEEIREMPDEAVQEQERGWRERDIKPGLTAATARRLGIQDDIEVHADPLNTKRKAVYASGRTLLQAVMKKYQAENGMTDQQIDESIRFMDGMADYMRKAGMRYRFIGIDDINDAKIIIDKRNGTKTILSAKVKNGEYELNFDFTKVCKKRVAFSKFIDDLASRPGRKGGVNMLDEITLTAGNIFRMNEILRDAGYETACLGCFVESRRYSIKNWAEVVMNEWNDAVDQVNPNAGYFNFATDTEQAERLTLDDINAIEKEMAAYKQAAKGTHAAYEKVLPLVQNSERLQRKLRIGDLISAQGRTALHAYSAELESIVASRWGSNTPKSVEAFAPYNSEIELLPDYKGPKKNNLKMTDYVSSIAGVRSQSFSDFIVTHVFDHLQKTMGLAARGMTAHTYTKEISRALLFGMTGEKVNLSLMFEIDTDVDWMHAGLDKNGDYFVADYETAAEIEKKTGKKQFTYSIPFRKAVEIEHDPIYSKYCGIIGVGYSYYGMQKMYRDGNIPYIIGYHRSGLPNAVMAATHIQLAADYTPVQNTLKFSGGYQFQRVLNADDYNIPSYATWKAGVKQTEPSDMTYDLKAELKRNGGDAHKTMTEFLEWMDENHLNPVTEKAQPGHGDFDVYGSLKRTNDPKATANEYIAWCIENNMIPQFFEFSGEENYFKGLFDYSVVDLVTGETAQQQPVKVDGLLDMGLERYQEITDKYMADYDRYNEEQFYSDRYEDTLNEIYESTQEASDEDTQFSLREKEPPKRTLIAYKAFDVVDGKLYPPMVKNDADNTSLGSLASAASRKKTGEAKGYTSRRGQDTPMGVWLDADVGAMAVDNDTGEVLLNTRGRPYVVNAKGGTLSFRPGWHLGAFPSAAQFLIADKDGNAKAVQRDDIVYAEVEISADYDYQLEALSYGVGLSKKNAYTHNAAGLPMVPVDGYYKYRTNPTDGEPWYIAGSIRIKRLLTDAECRQAISDYNEQNGTDYSFPDRYSGNDFNFEAYGLQPGDVVPDTDLDAYRKTERSYANDKLLADTLERIKQIAKEKGSKTYGYQSQPLDFNDPSIIEAFNVNQTVRSAEEYQKLYEKYGTTPFSTAEADEDVQRQERDADYQERDDGANDSIAQFQIEDEDYYDTSGMRWAYRYLSDSDKAELNSALSNIEHRKYKWYNTNDEGVKVTNTKKLIIFSNGSYKDPQVYCIAKVLSEDAERLITTYMEEVYGDGLQRVNGVKALAAFQNVLERGEVVGLFQRADWELQFQRGKGRSGESDSEGTWGRTGRVTDNKYHKVSLLSEKTIDKYLEDYANKEDRDYAQAYVTSISPEDYIWLTTTKQSAEWVKEDSRELEAEEFISSKVPITLTVDESGKVIDHDGVHRMQSLYWAGVKERVPILVFDATMNGNAQPVGMKTLTGQFEAYSGKYDRFGSKNIWNLTPLNYNNRAAIKRLYGTEKQAQKNSNQKHNTKTLQFQNRESVVSDRELLRMASEAAAKTETEKDYLKEYKKTVGAMDSLTAEIEKQRAAVDQFRAEGNVDSAEYLKAKEELARLDAKFDRAAERAVKLERQQPLKNVMRKVRQETESTILGALVEMRENGAKTTAEALEKQAAKYEEQLAELERKVTVTKDKGDMELALSRQRMQQKAEEYREKIRILREEKNLKIAKEISNRREAVERVRRQRDAGVVRDKIRRVINDFNARLKNPAENKYIPKDMVRGIIDALETFDMSYERHGEQMVSAKIKEMQGVYDSLKKDTNYAGVYDEQISDAIAGLSAIMQGKRFSQLTLEDLEDVYRVIKALHKTVTEANHAKAIDYAKEIGAIGRAMIDETNAAAPIAKGALGEYINWQLTPDRMFKRLGGYKKNSAWESVARALTKAEERYYEVQREAQMFFQDLAGQKEFEDLVKYDEKHLVDIGLVDADTGKKLPITRGMMLEIWMHLQNEENAEGFRKGGFTIPGLKEYYTGHGDKAYSTRQHRTYGVSQRAAEIAQQMYDEYGEIDETILKEERNKLEEESQEYLVQLYRNISKELTDFEKKLAERVREWNDERSRNMLNEVTMDLYGFEKAKVENYYHIRRDLNYVGQDFQSVKFDANLSNIGILKDRVPSSAPIMLGDITYTMSQSVNQTARYVGYAKFQRDFNKIYNTKLPGMTDSVKRAVSVKFGSGKDHTIGVTGGQYIDNLIQDVVGSRQRSEDSIFAAIRRNMPRATLSANIRVALSQLASIPTAAAKVGFGSMARGTINGFGNAFSTEAKNRIAAENVWFWQRYRGEGGMVEFSDMKDGGNIIDRAYNRLNKATKGLIFNWCQNFDVAATSMMQSMAEDWVKHHTNLHEGTDEFKQAVNDKFTEVLRETQPMYVTSARSDLMRGTNELMKMFVMYKTQANQNFNIIYDANAEAVKMIRDYKAHANGVTQEDVATAKETLAQSMASVLFVAPLTYAALRFIGNALMMAFKKYKDDDDEVTLMSVLQGIGAEAASSVASMSAMMGDIYDAIYTKITDGYSYGLNDSALGTIGEIYDTLMKEDLTDIKTWEDVGMSLSEATGVPVQNIIKFGTAGAAWFNALREGDLFAGVHTDTTYAARITNAYINGNSAAYYDAVNDLTSAGKDQDDIDKLVEKYVHARYKTGSIDMDTAQSILKNVAHRSDAQAYTDIDKWNYERENGTSNGYNKYQALDDAFSAGDYDAAMSEYNRLVGAGMDEKGIRSRATEKYNSGDATNLTTLYFRRTSLHNNEAYDNLIGAIISGDGIQSEISALRAKGTGVKKIMAAINSAFGTNKDVYYYMKLYNPAQAEILLNNILDAYENIGLKRDEEADWIRDNWLYLDRHGNDTKQR